MSPDDDGFDDTILTELDEALNSLIDFAAAEAIAKADQGDARRTLRVFTTIDLFRRDGRLRFTRSDVAAKEKYQIIAQGIRDILSAWGDAPPKFAQFCAPQDVYEKLHPLYLKALAGATRTE